MSNNWIESFRSSQNDLRVIAFCRGAFVPELQNFRRDASESLVRLTAGRDFATERRSVIVRTVDRCSGIGLVENWSQWEPCIYRRGATVSSSRRWTTEPSNNAGLLDGCATGTKKGNPRRRLYEYYMHPYTYPSRAEGGVCPNSSTRAWPLSSSTLTDSLPISPSFALRSATPRRPRRQRRLRYFMRWQWPSRIADWSAFWDGQPSRHSPSYQREGGV